MTMMLDEEHEQPYQKPQDDNSYTFGRIFEHNVVIACLPSGSPGKSAATAVAVSMLNSFTIKFGLMVGIGGGVPGPDLDIRLGDIVVSSPKDTHGGVVQYDLGKMEVKGFHRTGHLDKPPKALLSAINALRAKHETRIPGYPGHLSAIEKNTKMAKKYGYQGSANDRLFSAQDIHPQNRKTCDQCAFSFKVVERAPRTDSTPEVFYGTIGSGDVVMKDGEERDKRAAIDNVICFEMEAAGLMNHFPCLVIRGISDYADSHKNDRWQPYAAATAAAYAKELLGEVNHTEVEESSSASRII
ncbi:purine and uridine phosphorylase [Aureobasidium subglaciale]|nr:purine and uridine phosphorylase [Aureobasidium subglaciale]